MSWQPVHEHPVLSEWPVRPLCGVHNVQAQDSRSHTCWRCLAFNQTHKLRSDSDTRKVPTCAVQTPRITSGESIQLQLITNEIPAGRAAPLPVPAPV